MVEIATGITLPKSAEIGPGLRIWHFGNIVIHADVKIGSECTLRHGVTIGDRNEDGVPTLGDRVEIGAYAQILGPISVGNDAKIGCMAVVLRDVPAGATAVGNPARIIPSRIKQVENANSMAITHVCH
jgi:serine O-acetyltransferase